jgi:hypothetical protein
LSPERLAEIRAKTEAATPGPWKLWAMEVMADLDGTSNVDTAVGVAQTFGGTHPGRTNDAEFIAMARTAIPELLQALEMARAEERERCAKAIEDFRLFCSCPDIKHEVPLDDRERFAEVIRALR